MLISGVKKFNVTVKAGRALDGSASTLEIEFEVFALNAEFAAAFAEEKMSKHGCTVTDIAEIVF